MEYTTIQVPAPDFGFEIMAKRKALEISEQNFHIGQFKNPYTGTTERMENEIRQQFLNLRQEERVFYIVELLNRLATLKSKHQLDHEQLYINRPLTIIAKNNFRDAQDNITDLQYILYRLLSDCGYDLDKNTFTEDEAKGLDSKIDEILEIVRIVKMGQEALGEELQDLKDELESVKSEKAFGKKITIQRLKGITFEFLVSKLKDESYDAIKTALIALLVQHGFNIADIIPKLIGGH